MMNNILRKLSEDRLIILVCIFSAFLLWTSSQLAKTAKRTIEVKMVYNSAQNKALASEMPQVLEVNLEGSGWSLLFSDFKKQTTWNFDLPDVYDHVMTESEIIKKLKNDFNIDNIEVLKLTPTHLLIKQDSLVTKTVPINTSISVQCLPEFVLKEEAYVNPNMVQLRGPKKMIDRVDSWSIGDVHIEQVHQELIFNKNIDLKPGNKLLQISPQKITITAEFEELTEKIITVPIAFDTSGYTNIDRIYPKEVELKLRIGLSKFNEIHQSDFLVGIDIDSINISNTYIIKIKDSPKDINLVSISPSFVDVYFKDD